MDHLAIAPIHGEGAVVTGFVGIVEDVTVALANEQRLRKAGRMDAVGLLAAGLAHDLNNVMMAIAMGVELAKTDLAGDGVRGRTARLDSLDIVAAAADRHAA
jgi:signal transduction histidine kinase